MYALEFETDISGKTVTLPTEVASKISQGQHVRIIMLLDEVEQATAKPAGKNPLAALLESELIGCAEADPKLSRNYKAELSKSWGKKHGYR
jgi:hypothetical protein